MGVFADFERLEADSKTPVDKTICPDCGSTMVMIGVAVSPPIPEHKIWKTVFSGLCVHTAEWRWCCGGLEDDRGGHLDVTVAR
jgi:hypothetical protein